MNERQVAWGVGHVYLEDKKGNYIIDKSTGNYIIDKSKDQWASIKEGRFESDLMPVVIPLWRARWPGRAHSLDLIPLHNDPNMTYVHVECVPCVYNGGPNGELITDPAAKPMRPGLRFTKAQHETVARLAWDIAQRHKWPLYTDNLCDISKKSKQPWWRSSCLLGHEDITPLSRLTDKQCWDPGWLRKDQHIDWIYIYNGIAAGRAAILLQLLPSLQSTLHHRPAGCTGHSSSVFAS